MTNLAHIAEQLKGMSEDFVDLEKSLAQTERERRAYECSLDRIPELIEEGKLLAEKHRMNCAVVRSLSGALHLVAADSSNKKDFIVFIPTRQR